MKKDRYGFLNGKKIKKLVLGGVCRIRQAFFIWKIKKNQKMLALILDEC